MGSAIEGIARTYTTRPLLDEFAAAAALQREANALLAHTARPGEVIELYLMIAEAGALMASCAFDLGQSDRAMQLASASLIYADRAGDPSVSAWLLGLQASLDLWTARPARALDSVERGLSIAAAGQPRFRLHHIGARAAAAASNHQLAANHLQSAEEEWGSARYDRLGDGVAGEFHFDRARADACAAATGLTLGDWDRVVTSAQQSIDHYGASPAAARVPMLGARLDLATAMVHRGDMSSAADHLETAFGEAAEHRYSLVVRVRRVADHLAPRRREVQASRLVDLTTEWLAGTA